MGLLDTAITFIEPRKLPIYLLIDTSSCMKGERIESVKLGIENLLSALRKEPFALETAYISIITYDRCANQLIPLTSIEELEMPEITTCDFGAHMGGALELLLEKKDKELIRTSAERKGDYKPILFLLAGGQPIDEILCKRIIQKVRPSDFTAIVCCAAGPESSTEYLKLLTDKVYQVDTLDNASMMKLFTWLAGIGKEHPYYIDNFFSAPLPEEINAVI